MNQNTEYEILTKEIYEALLEKEGNSNITNVQHDISIEGKSGCKHQIDVYWEYKLGGITNKIAIECKNYKSKVSIGKIRDFKSVVEDIGANGIFVSREGYQSGAKDFAKHCGIALREVRFPKSEDWEGLIKKIFINMNLKSTRIKSRTPILDKQWIRKNVEFKSGEKIFEFNGNQKEFIIYNFLGGVITNLYEIENKLETFEESKENIEFIHIFKDSYIKNSKGALLKIDSIKYIYDSISIKMDINLNSEESVKAILKNVENNEIQFFNKN